MFVLKLLIILLAIDTALVLGTYAIWLYETRNADITSGATHETTAAGRIYGIIGEILASFCSLLLYPAGYMMTEFPSRIQPGERPLILCHGYMHNRSAFIVLRHRLQKAGRNNVIVPNFRPSSGSVSVFARQLSETVRRASSKVGCNEVDLVGHSMGGLVVRYFVENLDGRACVRNAITVGGPNAGTKMAALGLLQTAGQFRPGSALLSELNGPEAAGDGVKYTALWSDFDNIILPPENAKLPEPCASVMIENVGHLALLFSRRVFREVLAVVALHENT